MWAVALIVTLSGVTTVFPGSVLLYSEADCHKFGEIWEQVYSEKSGLTDTDHVCTEIRAPGVDV